MNINTSLLGVCFLCCGLLSSCWLREEPKPVPAPPPTPVERTVLVYQSANNNLGSNNFDQMDIQEMITAAKQGNIPSGGRLLVFNAAYRKAPLLLEIKQSGIDTLKTYSLDTMAVERSRMTQVFKDMTVLAPAADYGLIMWNHGSGWLQDGIAEESAATMSFGLENGRTMNITTLADILRAGPRMSFIYFDCCYMSSVETLYQLRDVTPVFAGSATELQVYGMPYDQTVADFFRQPQADIVGAARKTFELYDAMSADDRTCTMSVINSEGLKELADATAEIYSRAEAEFPKGYAPQRFMTRGINTCYYFDFRDYVAMLCVNADGTDRFDGAAELLARFDSAMAKTVIYAAATPKIWDVVDIKHHCGLSTYILRDSSSPANKNYYSLAWYQNVAANLKLK